MDFVNKGPSVRLNFEYISTEIVPGEATSSGYGETFLEGMKNAIEFYNSMQKMYQGIDNASGKPNQTIYYTNQADGYFFYTKDDLEETDEQTTTD